MGTKVKNQRLTQEQIDRIRLLHRRGFDYVTLALIFRVTPQRVQQLCRDDRKGDVIQLIADMLPHLPPNPPYPRCFLTPKEIEALHYALGELEKLGRIQLPHEFIKCIDDGHEEGGDRR